jgi:hypothetical protein
VDLEDAGNRRGAQAFGDETALGAAGELKAGVLDEVIEGGGPLAAADLERQSAVQRQATRNAGPRGGPILGAKRDRLEAARAPFRVEGSRHRRRDDDWWCREPGSQESGRVQVAPRQCRASGPQAVGRERNSAAAVDSSTAHLHPEGLDLCRPAAERGRRPEADISEPGPAEVGARDGGG